MMFTLDSYAARSCPLKTFLAHRPGTEAPSAIPSGLPGATEFVTQVLNDIVAAHPDSVDLRRLAHRPSAEQSQACLAAMKEQSPVIVSAVLPRDIESHRRGRVDLLIRDEAGGYLPGIVKYQRALDSRRDEHAFEYSSLTDITTRRRGTGWRYRWNWRWANAIQLAHFWELLASTGYGSPEQAGLVIGSDRVEDLGPVGVWLDLARRRVPAPPGRYLEPTQVAALDRYRDDFADRVALAHSAINETVTDFRPIVTGECGYCRWWATCRPQIDDDDVNLRINKSPLDRHEIERLRAAGVTTIADLAAADLDALHTTYLPEVADRPGAEDRLHAVHRRATLLNRGLDIDRLTNGAIDVPQASVEIDIDVETSRSDRVYLWGFWVDDPSGGHYQEFSSFTDLDADGELQLARTALTWLRETVRDTDAKLYHYSDYEVLRLSRLAALGDPTLIWAYKYAQSHFVDLFGIVRRHFFGANGLGLKAMASAGAGFHWRDQDPGGLNSMKWFETAVTDPDPVRRTAARERILAYNEDDVRATYALRWWLRSLE